MDQCLNRGESDEKGGQEMDSKAISENLQGLCSRLDLMSGTKSSG